MEINILVIKQWIYWHEMASSRSFTFYSISLILLGSGACRLKCEFWEGFAELELAPKFKSVHGEKIAIISEASEIQTHRTVIFENEDYITSNIHKYTLHNFSLYPCFVFVNDFIHSQSDFTIALFFNTSNRSCLLQIVKIGNL